MENKQVYIIPPDMRQTFRIGGLEWKECIAVAVIFFITLLLIGKNISSEWHLLAFPVASVFLLWHKDREDNAFYIILKFLRFSLEAQEFVLPVRKETKK